MIYSAVMEVLPELLSPAGNLEKLYVAVSYGADAVYLSGERFGLRAGAGNFSLAEITEGTAFCKARSVKVYVTLNMFFHDEDFDGLAEYLSFLEAEKIDGVIVSDLGAVEFVRTHSKLPIHLSTQSSCLNSSAAAFWRDFGISRIVTGRELSIAEACVIKERSGLEIEMFIHGAMCMAYSGNCVISNYTAGRDSNRGGCNQSCRYPYQRSVRRGLEIISAEKPARHFLSSKDMIGVREVPLFIAGKIDSLKIEGRMKSPLYVAATTAAYRRALNVAKTGNFKPSDVAAAESMLESIPHRDYIPGAFTAAPGNDSTYTPPAGGDTSGQFAGIVLDRDSELLSIRAHSVVGRGSIIDFISFDGTVVPHKLELVLDKDGCALKRTRPGEVFQTPINQQLSNLPRYTVARTGACAV